VVFLVHCARRISGDDGGPAARLAELALMGLFGLSQAALATCWYARGRMDALRAICGGMGVILVFWNLVLAR
jgi:hypothetical protein